MDLRDRRSAAYVPQQPGPWPIGTWIRVYTTNTKSITMLGAVTEYRQLEGVNCVQIVRGTRGVTVPLGWVVKVCEDAKT